MESTDIATAGFEFLTTARAVSLLLLILTLHIHVSGIISDRNTCSNKPSGTEGMGSQKSGTAQLVWVLYDLLWEYSFITSINQVGNQRLVGASAQLPLRASMALSQPRLKSKVLPSRTGRQPKSTGTCRQVLVAHKEGVMRLPPSSEA